MSINATMHLDHKPGEIMQVDWTGDTAEEIDTDTGEVIDYPELMYTFRVFHKSFLVRLKNAEIRLVDQLLFLFFMFYEHQQIKWQIRDFSGCADITVMKYIRSGMVPNPDSRRICTFAY